MYYPVNNFSNCTIFNKSLYQDLESYDLQLDSDMNLKVKYQNDTTPKDVSLNLDAILSYISSTDYTEDLWQPCFIDSSTNTYSQYHHILNKTINTNPIYGISNVLSFEPKFKNWEIINSTPTDYKMNCDWYINSILGCEKLYYGLMFWFKYTSYGYKKNIKFQDLLDGTKFVLDKDLTVGNITIDKNSPMVKLDNNNIKLLNKKQFKIITSTNITDKINKIDFNTEQYIVKTSEISNQSLLNNCKLYKDDALVKNNKNIEIYISNGECFSYFYGIADQLKNKNYSMPSRTYLSPVLSKIYREIYHRLTLYSNKSFNPSMSLYSSKLFQQLCYYLSSGPLMDRTTIDILNDREIYDAVQLYINRQYSNNAQSEINSLSNILNTIYSKYINLSTSLYDQTLVSNYVNTKKDLFKTLTNKYGLSLLISGKATLKYKHTLPNGPHAFLSTNYQNWRPKTISNTQPSYNNNSIKIGNISYSSNIYTTDSTIQIKADNFSPSGTIEIPLADVSLTKKKPASFYIGPPINIENTDTNSLNEIEFSLNNISIDFGANNTDRNVTYFWEHIRGPNCLRFDNYAKNNTTTKRYFTSTTDTPKVYVKQTGLYELKCTRSNYGSTESDTLLLSFGSPITQQPQINIAELEQPTDYPKIMLSNFKSLAFNKRGLVWIVDSENYVDTDQFNDRDDIDEPGIIKLKDIKIDLNQKEKVNVLESNADLELTFDNSNGSCLTSLFGITIENMRDDTYKYSQCKSFYQEKIKRLREKTNMNIPELGASNFYRESVATRYKYIYHNTNGKISNKYADLISPNSSTQYAPPILPYGGYGSGIVDTIGIRMSGHPTPVSGYVYTPTGIINIQNKLPIIKDRSSVLSFDENNPIACHLKEIQPTGDKHYTIFNKGHFHPLSGWLSASSNSNLSGKSNVVLNLSHKKNSYKFDGVGLASIKSLCETGNTTIYKTSIVLEEGNIGDLKDKNDVYGFNNKNYNAKYNPNYLIDENQDDWIYNYNGCGEATRTYGLDNITANKNINNVEIQLSFINHINPKNISIWLDISNNINPISGIAPHNTGIFIDNKTSLPMVLETFSGNLTAANSGSSGYRIYLLNQQNISNYTNNFSITFTDYANKNNDTDRRAYVPYLINTIKNNEQIQPTLGAVSGLNDINITNNILAIKNNQYNLSNNFLIKLGGLPLKGTKFTLNIANIQPLDHDNIVRDNLVANSVMSSTFDNHYYSSILSDNICKWSVIVHTTGTRDYVDSDILGYIDYKNSISGIAPSGYFIDTPSNRLFNNGTYNGDYTPINPSGYDFIGDFTDKNFLIPLVNINAPYQSLANINQCIYNDPDIPRFRSSLPPQLPSLVSYAFIGLTAALGVATGGLLGAMAGVSMASFIISQGIKSGGRNDPITNFFINSRNYNLSVSNNSQFYKPIYGEETYGYGDRAIIAISKDGAVWYNVEVPIFKYSNTPTCHKNTYKYIKLNQYAPEVLSKFDIRPIKDISDLNLSNVVGSISTNVTETRGLYSIEDINLKDNNIILLTNQTSMTNNGYWVVGTGNWVKIPSQNSLYFLSYNRIGSNMSTSLDNSSTINKNVLLDGIRAYNFFDIGETVEFVSPSGATATIEDKSIISTDSGQKTILTLSSGIQSIAKIFKPSGTLSDNVIFLYKDQCTVSNGDGSYIPFNMWSYESKDSYSIHPQTPQTRISTIGEGSIGWGTDTIFPSLINRIGLVDNTTVHREDIFNNDVNDLYKLNTINIVGYDNIQSIISLNSSDEPKNKIKASSYSYDSIGFSVNTNSLNKDPILKQLNQTYQYDNKNKIILDLKSNKFNTIPQSGYICLEGDLLFYKTVRFSEADVSSMNTRSSALIASSNNFNPSQISDIYSISSIPDFIKYYDSLPDDPIECEQMSKPSNIVCKKALANKRLHELYQEQASISRALSIHDGSVQLPHISGIVTSNLPTGLKINYKENNDLYWIHLDPNQQCYLNDELTVKVLTKGSAFPIPIVQNFIPNNIITPNIDSVNKFLPSGKDVSIKFNGTEISYTIPDSIVQQNKAKIKTDHPDLIWNTDETFIYGKIPTENDFSNSKKIMINDGESSDYIIQLKENYIRPAGLSKFSKLSDIMDLSTINSLKIKFRNLTRKIKSIDSEAFARYTYDFEGNLVKDNKPASSVGQIANNFTCWQCFNTSGVYITGLPPFLQTANEMRYRAFFGSIDGIEHKNTFVSDSQEDWEWIPFEYFTPSGQPLGD